MLAASSRAGTMTVRDGLSGGERLCCGRARLGMRGRPTLAVMAFQSQARATSHAVS